MKQDSIVIVSAVRTPMGGLLGCFKEVTASQLGATAIKEAVNRAHLRPQDIEEVLMGCVLQAGQGQAPARQAAIAAGLPVSTPCTTVNKMCGSGMKAVMLAHDALVAGTNKIVVAGGMESMTNAPYLLDRARAGYRMGHGIITDHMFLDGLEDAYDKGRLMGVFAEECAKQYQFSREIQDQFAIRSLKRAQQAIAEGSFQNEIVPVSVNTKQGTIIVNTDEQPGNAKFDKIPLLKPAFDKNGTVTAANSSSISDGAAALVLMHKSEAKQRGLIPLATIVAFTSHAQEPNLFTTAPIAAMQKLFIKTNWSVNDVDLFEINEAFAVVALAAIKDLQLSPEKVNIHGGACALGHPIGASGARILTTLIYALQKNRLKRGVAALCIGGGEATAMAIELE
jgi:acetyl-CoA C-acetyltransferase